MTQRRRLSRAQVAAGAEREVRPGVTRVPVEPGTLAHVGWREYGHASMRRPLAPATTTINGSPQPASVWERLRWGDEWTDGAIDGGLFGTGQYLHVRALLAGEPEDGERVVYRVRSRLIPGRRVLLIDGTTEARAVVASVGLARDPRGAGGWAWTIGLRATGRARRKA